MGYSSYNFFYPEMNFTLFFIALVLLTSVLIYYFRLKKIRNTLYWLLGVFIVIIVSLIITLIFH